MSTQVLPAIELIDKARLSLSEISFDSMVSTTAVTIKAGSKISVSGALYDFTVDEVESGGTWAGIGASSTVFIYIVPAGASATWIYSTTVPTWDVAKQGYYNSGNRAVAFLWKDTVSAYFGKAILKGRGLIEAAPEQAWTPVSYGGIGTPTSVTCTWKRTSISRIRVQVLLTTGTFSGAAVNLALPGSMLMDNSGLLAGNSLVGVGAISAVNTSVVSVVGSAGSAVLVIGSFNAAGSNPLVGAIGSVFGTGTIISFWADVPVNGLNI